MSTSAVAHNQHTGTIWPACRSLVVQLWNTTRWKFISKYNTVITCFIKFRNLYIILHDPYNVYLSASQEGYQSVSNSQHTSNYPPFSATPPPPKFPSLVHLPSLHTLTYLYPHGTQFAVPWRWWQHLPVQFQKCEPNHTASCPRRLESLTTLLWKPLILINLTKISWA
jgi:hypothetical protein